MAALAAIGLATPATAAPIELVEQREQYMLFRDPTGMLQTANWFSRDPFLEAYADVEDGFLAVHADDSQFLIIYTTWQLPPPVGALYQSVANDVHGIGYEHIAPLDAIIETPYFDDTPNSQVQGFMHMNDWTQYLGRDPGGVDDTTISLIFGQELGHAWLAFVYWADDASMTIRDDMLGRSDAHWSFYLDSGGSPVEGHDWVDNGDGTFTAIKHDIYTFSELDLYLMGLLPASEVQPWFVLQDVYNCVDSAADDGSCAPPEAHRFEADSYTVNATRRDITIEDVIAAEGERMPPFGEAPTQFDASFLLITRPDEELSEGELQQMDTIIERSLEIFNQQTDGHGEVINRTAIGGGGSGGDGAADDGADGGTAGGGDGTAGGEAGGSGMDDAAGGTGGGAGSAGGSGGATGPAEEDGCGCTSAPAPATRGWPVWALLLLGLRSRGRRWARGTLRAARRGAGRAPRSG